MTMLAREIFNADHEAFRDAARRFFEREVAPQHGVSTHSDIVAPYNLNYGT